MIKKLYRHLPRSWMKLRKLAVCFSSLVTRVKQQLYPVPYILRFHNTFRSGLPLELFTCILLFPHPLSANHYCVMPHFLTMLLLTIINLLPHNVLGLQPIHFLLLMSMGFCVLVNCWIYLWLTKLLWACIILAICAGWFLPKSPWQTQCGILCEFFPNLQYHTDWLFSTAVSVQVWHCVGNI